MYLWSGRRRYPQLFPPSGGRAYAHHPEPVGPGSAAAGGRHWLSPAALHDCGRRACFSGRRAARRRRPAADHGRRDVMRVGMLGSISWRTPPRGYGPWELVTTLLTEALVPRGLRSDAPPYAPQSLMRISYADF